MRVVRFYVSCRPPPRPPRPSRPPPPAPPPPPRSVPRRTLRMAAFPIGSVQCCPPDLNRQLRMAAFFAGPQSPAGGYVPRWTLLNVIKNFHMVRPESVILKKSKKRSKKSQLEKSKSKKQIEKSKKATCKIKSKKVKKVNHGPQLEKGKKRKREQKSKVWLLALADYWSQENINRSTTRKSQKNSKKTSRKKHQKQVEKCQKLQKQVEKIKKMIS